MSETRITVHKKGLVVLISILVGLILFFVWLDKISASEPIYSCTQAFSQGIHDIKLGDKNYRPSLDRDRDGVACEQ